MTREHKLSLVIGFSVMLAVGVLISDHLSSASTARLEGEQADEPTELALRQIDLVQPTDTHDDAQSEPVAADARPGEPETEQSAPMELALDTTPSNDEPTLDDLTERVDSGFVPIIIANGADLVQTELPVAAMPGRIDTPVRTHTVRADDTLFSLCKTYYGTGHIWRQLQAHNADRIGADGTLSLGVVLVIPARESLLGDPVPTAPRREPTPEPITLASTYTVQPGDMLGTIAQDQLGTVKRMDELIALNDLDEPDDIRVGMVLKLPTR